MGCRSSSLEYIPDPRPVDAAQEARKPGTVASLRRVIALDGSLDPENRQVSPSKWVQELWRPGHGIALLALRGSPPREMQIKCNENANQVQTNVTET